MSELRAADLDSVELENALVLQRHLCVSLPGSADGW
jgi:hypothetical protein